PERVGEVREVARIRLGLDGRLRIWERPPRAPALDTRRARAPARVAGAPGALDRRGIARERLLEPAETHERVTQVAREVGLAAELERARGRGGGPRAPAA